MGSILIVDDDENVRASLREVLEDAGHFVLEASNGREALDRLETCSPSLVLLDMIMPIMGGSELLSVLRDDGRLPGLAVVIITVHPRDSDMDGAHVLMNKPVSARHLAAMVRSFLSDRTDEPSHSLKASATRPSF